MNPDVFLGQVKRGERLTEAELDFVRRGLAHDRTTEDKYTLIHILWKARDVKSTGLILAQVFDTDEMVRRIALQALADLQPSEEVFSLALSMARDPSKYVRSVAATTIGTLGGQLPRRTAEAARLLLEGFDRHRSDEDYEWESYYEGLLDLVRVPYGRRPLPTRALRRADVDAGVIASARTIASGS